jgi:hypothetical protein
VIVLAAAQGVSTIQIVGRLLADEVIQEVLKPPDAIVRPDNRVSENCGVDAFGDKALDARFANAIQSDLYNLGGTVTDSSVRVLAARPLFNKSSLASR